MKAMQKLAELFRYRELLKNLVVNELKLRYRRSVLGFLWTMLNPLFTLLTLTLVMSTILRYPIERYWVSLFSGFLPWMFLSQSIGLALMSVVGKGPLLQKVYIPKIVIPLSAVLSTLVNFLLALVPLLGLVVIAGHPVNESLLFLPVAIVFITLFTVGLGFLFSCLNVFFRDFTHMTEVILNLWYHLSPVWYTLEMLPERYRVYLSWNPLVYIFECFREPIFHGRIPSLATISISAAAALASFVFGLAIFLRFERHFVVRL
jgi:ABC-2 type transport system permease protein